MDTDALDFYLDNDRNVNFPTLIQHGCGSSDFDSFS